MMQGTTAFQGKFDEWCCFKIAVPDIKKKRIKKEENKNKRENPEQTFKAEYNDSD